MATQLQNYIRLVVDELQESNGEGCLIQTKQCPTGFRVKAQLHLVVADSLARAKLGGFFGRKTRGPIYAYCPFHCDHSGMTNQERLSAIQEALEAFKDSPSDQQNLAKSFYTTTAGFRRSVLGELDYFDLAKSMPPDAMHAIVLRLCKRFWWNFPLNSCQIQDRGRIAVPLNIKPPLAQTTLPGGLLPSKLEPPTSNIGLPGGGQPTAEQ